VVVSEVEWRIIGGGLAAVAVALAARRLHALSPSGALAAVVVGTAIVGAGGWWWGALLVAFFVTASALSRVARRRDAGKETIAARGGERDAVQVAANGGLPALLALLAPLGERSLLFVAFAGAIASVTADTWATELGAFSPSPPRMIVSGRRVPRGTSGGITPLGTAAALAGAATIAAGAALGAWLGWAPARAAAGPILGGVAVAGFAGALADSLLGATLQASYRCPVCGRPTEHRAHCATPTRRIHGLGPVTNDVVNAAAALGGAIAAAALILAVG